jgi:hypothetical protein
MGVAPSRLGEIWKPNTRSHPLVCLPPEAKLLALPPGVAAEQDWHAPFQTRVGNCMESDKVQGIILLADARKPSCRENHRQRPVKNQPQIFPLVATLSTDVSLNSAK